MTDDVGAGGASGGSAPEFRLPADYDPFAPVERLSYPVAANSARSGQPDLTPDSDAAARSRRRRRRAWLVSAAFAVVAVVIGVVVAAQSRQRPSKPFGFDGLRVTNPRQALTQAETSLAAFMAGTQHATDKHPRCWFAVPTTQASGTSAAYRDVSKGIWCGQVLFAGSERTRPFVRFEPGTEPDGEGVRLLPPRRPTYGYSTFALPTDYELVRPDGRTPPAPTTLFLPPVAPAGDPATLVSTADTVAANLVGSDVILRGAHVAVTLDSFGSVGGFGAGPQARTQPYAHRFLAFTMHVTWDAGVPHTLPDLRVSLDGATGRPVPSPERSSETKVVAVAGSTQRVDLVLTELGERVRVSLRTGEPDPHNVPVLMRHTVFRALGTRTDLSFRIGQSPQSPSITASYSLKSVRLTYWVGGANLKPASRTDAWLVLDQSLDLGTSAGQPIDFQPDVLTLTLPGGRAQHARRIPVSTTAGASSIDVFEVPAYFTSGRLVIKGSQRSRSGELITIDRPVQVDIALPLR